MQGATMRRRFGPIERCGGLLFGGYLLFFLLRHDPYPRAVPGLLVVALPSYAQFNPLVMLSQRPGISAAWFTSGVLLIVLGFLFIVYFRLLHTVQRDAQQYASDSVENLPRRANVHQKAHNFRIGLVGILAGVVLFSL